MPDMIWFLYFSAMMLVNCEMNARATGEGSLRMRHLKARAAAAERGFPWAVNWSAALVTVGCMVAGIVVPLIFLSLLASRLNGTRR